MKLLVLNPADVISPADSGRWDLIVDISRAPLSTYQKWGEQTRCPVLSIHDYSEGVQDLYRLRELLEAGMGAVSDDQLVDWWDILSLMISGEMLDFILVERLSRTLPRRITVECSRPSPLALGLARLLESPLQY